MALFGCWWLPDFPCWAEVQADPSLQAQPVFVYRGGRVVAASAAAKQCGITHGWTLPRALSLVPHAVALPLDAAACAFNWERVLETLYDLTPRIQTVRQGLAFFEVPARRTGQDALARLVAKLDARCGIAGDRALAELAALTAPAATVRTVRAGRESSFLRRVPVDVLCEAGVSLSTVERLHWFGLCQVAQLKALSRRQICEQFEDGPKLWRLACAGTSGADRSMVSSYIVPLSVEMSLAFEQPATQPGEWEAALDELLQRACRELNGRLAASFSVAVETQSGRRAASRLLREPVGTPRPLREPARVMLCDLLGDAQLHALQVRLGNLSTRAGQGELFETSLQRVPALRVSVLREVLCHLEARHAGAVLRLHARNLHSALPEERYALEPWLQSGMAQQERKPQQRQQQQRATGAMR